MLTRLLNRSKVLMNQGIDSAIDALQKYRMGKDVSEKVEKKIVEIFKGDADVQYVVEGFRKKYHIGNEDLFVAPLVQGNSLKIEEYALCLNSKPIITAQGFEEVMNAITEAVILEDPEIKDAIRVILYV